MNIRIIIFSYLKCSVTDYNRNIRNVMVTFLELSTVKYAVDRYIDLTLCCECVQSETIKMTLFAFSLAV